MKIKVFKIGSDQFGNCYGIEVNNVRIGHIYYRDFWRAVIETRDVNLTENLLMYITGVQKYDDLGQALLEKFAKDEKKHKKFTLTYSFGVKERKKIYENENELKYDIDILLYDDNVINFKVEKIYTW